MARGRPKKNKDLSTKVKTPKVDLETLGAKTEITPLSQSELEGLSSDNNDLSLEDLRPSLKESVDTSMKGVEELDYSELVVSNEEKLSDNKILPMDNAKDLKPYIEIDETEKLSIEDYQKHFNRDYFDKLKNNGCDYKSFGDWQRAYCDMLVNAFKVKGGTILDIGCAYGSLTHAFKMKQCVSRGIDVSKDIMDDKFKSITIETAMVQSMPMIPDKSINLVHASYVLNHIPASELKQSFSEMSRVMKDNGFIFVIYNNGLDEVVGDFNYKHSKPLVIASALENGLVLIDASEQLNHCDNHGYKFMEKYNWCYHVFKRDEKK